MGITKKGGGKGKQSISVAARNVQRERLGGIANPVGTMCLFAGATTSVPDGWLLCDGSEYLKTMYPELWTLIGTTYGTGASGYFVLPDMRNKVPIGVSTLGLCATLGSTLARTSATGSSFTFIGLYFIIRAY
jgi:hypothetical protein